VAAGLGSAVVEAGVAAAEAMGEAAVVETGLAAAAAMGSAAAVARGSAAAEEAAAAAEAEGRNRCILVWCGAVAKPAFPRFRIELIRTVGGAAKYFEDVGARHLWDLAAAGVEVE